MIVRPHTPLIQKKVEDLTDWHTKGRPTKSPLHAWDDDSFGSPSAAQNFPKVSDRYMKEVQQAQQLVDGKPAAAEAACRVTFFIDQETVRNPNDFNAALNFVESRFDHDIGLWDLARDPVLRATLSKPSGADEVPKRPVQIPDAVTSSAGDARAAREAKRHKEKRARLRIHEAIWPHLGATRSGEWMPNEPLGSVYLLPVGELATEFGGVKRPWLAFNLDILKRQTRLRLLTGMPGYGHEVAELLERLRAELMRLTGAETRTDDADTDVFIVTGQGWGSEEYDGPKMARLASDAIDVLRPSWPDLERLARASYEEYAAKSAPYSETVEVRIKVPVDTKRRSKGVGRLFRKK